MNADFEIESGTGIFVLHDSTKLPQTPLTREAKGIGELKDQARIGNLFFIASSTDETTRYRIRVKVEEDLLEEPNDMFEEAAGSFRLEAPSGSLVISGDRVSNSEPQRKFRVASGTYLLRIFKQQFDSVAYRERMERLLGKSDARFARIVERFAVGGCLLTLAAAFLVMISFWRRYIWIIVAVASVPWLIHFVFRSLPRYRRIEKIRLYTDKQLPHFILILKRSEAAAALPGGWLQVPE